MIKDNTLDLWHEIWSTGPKTKIDRLDLDCFTPLERSLIKQKALELEQQLDTEALFFRVIKNNKTIYLQAILQVEV